MMQPGREMRLSRLFVITLLVPALDYGPTEATENLVVVFIQRYRIRERKFSPQEIEIDISFKRAHPTSLRIVKQISAGVPASVFDKKFGYRDQMQKGLLGVI